MCLLALGCSPSNKVPSWLIGKWEIDVASTQEILRSAASKSILAPVLRPALESAMANAPFLSQSLVMEFTPSAVIMLSDGTRGSRTITIVATSGSTIQLIDQNGTTFDIHRTEAGFWLGIGSTKAKVYFKKTNG